MTKRQEEIIKVYSRLAKSLQAYPSRSDLRKEGVTRDMIRDQFGDMDGLKEMAREENPKAFEDIVDMDYFNEDLYRAQKDIIRKHRRFVVTTAVAGGPVHEDFLASIKKFCELKDAALFVIPANYALQDLDNELVQDPSVNIVFRGLKLNSNISISPVKIDPKQVDPTIGLTLVGQREGTIILGSPKQRLLPVANSNTQMTRFLQATGAITKSRYVPSDGVPKRRDFLADKQHVVGAIVVEIVDDKFYYFRQVQANRDGSFNDLFVNYSEDGAKNVGCLAIIQGDYHVGETDPKADAVADELCARGKPKYRVLHDFFDGKSINHHELKNKVLRARQAEAKKLSLADELHAASQALKAKVALGTAQQIILTKSNHDEFLDRYLATGEFDDGNRVISTKLQLAAMEGRDPLRYAFEDLFGLKLKEKVRWLGRDEDFRISRGKVESGIHGDLGPNGARGGGVASMLKCYGDCWFGHTHRSEISHGAWNVGTTSFLKQDYNRGPSGWSQSHGIQYEDGTRQIILCIHGQYCLKD